MTDEQTIDALLDALAVRVPDTQEGTGQMTTWIWADEHDAATTLLRNHGRTPLASAHPRARA